MALTRIGNSAVPAGAVTQHVTDTDLQPVKSDISALALREATNESSAAFNLPNQFIDTFTDDTKLGTQTDVDRNSGYIASIIPNTDSNYSNVWLLLENNSTNQTSTQSGAADTTNPTMQTQSFATTQKKFGTHSLYFDASRGASTQSSVDFAPSGFPTIKDLANKWTLEMFVYNTNRNGSETDADYDDNAIWAVGDTYTSANIGGASGKIRFNEYDGSRHFQYWDSSYVLPLNTWVHLTFVWGASAVKLWVDGTYKGSCSRRALHSSAPANIRFGASAGGDAIGNFDGYMDNIRLTNLERYTGTSNITIPTVEHYPNGLIATATGTAIQAANAVGSAKTKVGGTMLYKDNAGTATLGTDLKIYFTCNGGTNWTEASSYSAITPVYSTGIKQVRLGETTCTSGTDIRYKAVWANQALGSKETQLHGIGVNY